MFVVAGRPYSCKPYGSYVPWGNLVAGAVTFADLPSPLETVSIVREQDSSGAVFRGLLDGLAAVAGPDGLTSSQILKGITGGENDYQTLRDVFNGITDKLTGRRIGNELRKYLNRVADGRRIIKAPGRAGVARWAVENVGSLIDDPKPSFVDEEPEPEPTILPEPAIVDAGQRFVTGAV